MCMFGCVVGAVGEEERVIKRERRRESEEKIERKRESEEEGNKTVFGVDTNIMIPCCKAKHNRDSEIGGNTDARAGRNCKLSSEKQNTSCGGKQVRLIDSNPNLAHSPMHYSKHKCQLYKSKPLSIQRESIYALDQHYFSSGGQG